MARILCVEDNSEFQIYLSSILSGHTLVHVSTIAEALRALESGSKRYDIILLDVSLPDGNSMKALPQIKDYLKNWTVPIIVISSDSDILTKVAAFGLGADDYVIKPPDSTELKARIEAKLRWASTAEEKKTNVVIGDIQIDLEQMTVEHTRAKSHERFIDLTPHEFKIFKLLAARPGQVFSREHIIERVWGVGKYITQRTVDAHISHLRTKLLAYQVHIDTVLGVGYKVITKDSLKD